MTDPRPMALALSWRVMFRSDLLSEALDEASRKSINDAPGGEAERQNNCEHQGFLRLLPSTCTTETLRTSTDGCAFQIPLDAVVGVRDLSLQVALALCPASLLPTISVSVGGVGAEMLLAPCVDDSQCGADQVCADPLRSALIRQSAARTQWGAPPGGPPQSEYLRQLFEGEAGKIFDALLTREVIEQITGIPLSETAYEEFLARDSDYVSHLRDAYGMSEEELEEWWEMMFLEPHRNTLLGGLLLGLDEEDWEQLQGLSSAFVSMDVGGELITWLRSFWDHTGPLEQLPGQVLPMCLPQGRASSPGDADAAGAVHTIGAPALLYGGQSVVVLNYENPDEAVQWPNGFTAAEAGAESQIFQFPKLMAGPLEGGGLSAGQDAWAHDGASEPLLHGDVVAWYHPAADQVYDCAHGACSHQPFPLPGGHWGSPYRIYQLGRSIGEAIHLCEPVYFDRMYGGVFNEEYSLRANSGGGALEGVTSMSDRSLFAMHSLTGECTTSVPAPPPPPVGQFCWDSKPSCRAIESYGGHSLYGTTDAEGDSTRVHCDSVSPQLATPEVCELLGCTFNGCPTECSLHHENLIYGYPPVAPQRPGLPQPSKRTCAEYDAVAPLGQSGLTMLELESTDGFCPYSDGQVVAGPPLYEDWVEGGQFEAVADHYDPTRDTELINNPSNPTAIHWDSGPGWYSFDARVPTAMTKFSYQCSSDCPGFVIEWSDDIRADWSEASAWSRHASAVPGSEDGKTWTEAGRMPDRGSSNPMLSWPSAGCHRFWRFRMIESTWHGGPWYWDFQWFGASGMAAPMGQLATGGFTYEFETHCVRAEDFGVTGAPFTRFWHDSTGCPPDFPYASEAYDRLICYKEESQATGGSGPCGSWCTIDINVGGGCGSNSDRLCERVEGMATRPNIRAPNMIAPCCFQPRAKSCRSSLHAATEVAIDRSDLPLP
eukprot:COSAG06_NODE_1444_length_9453_cov_2.850438_7_plen_940_part_00